MDVGDQHEREREREPIGKVDEIVDGASHRIVSIVGRGVPLPVGGHPYIWPWSV